MSTEMRLEGPDGKQIVVGQVDPLDYYDDVGPQTLLEAAGVLSHWAMQAIVEGTGIYDTMVKEYQFGGEDWLNPEGTFSNDVFSYPGDPDQYPIVRFEHKDEKVLIFRNAIVAQISKNGSFRMTRMD